MYDRYDRSGQMEVGEIEKWGRKVATHEAYPGDLTRGGARRGSRALRRQAKAEAKAQRGPWLPHKLGIPQSIDRAQGAANQTIQHAQHAAQSTIGKPFRLDVGGAAEFDNILGRAIGRKAKIALGTAGAVGLGLSAQHAVNEQRRTRAWEQMARNSGNPHGVIGKRESKGREIAGAAGTGTMAWGFSRSPMLRRALLRGAETSTGSEAALYRALLEAQEALKTPTGAFARGMKHLPPVRGGLKVIPRKARPGVALLGGSLLATGGSGIVPGAMVTGA